MKKILLAVALVLVIAIPASALVKHPTPMDIEVYRWNDFYGYYCNDDWNDNGQCKHCSLWFLGVCLGYADVPMTWGYAGSYHSNIYSAQVGSTFNVKATLLAEVAKNAKWSWMVKLGTEILYKSTKQTINNFNGQYTFGLGGFNAFTKPGMHSFIFQIFKPDGTILQAVKKIYVYAPPSASGLLEGIDEVQGQVEMTEEPMEETGELIIEEHPAEAAPESE